MVINWFIPVSVVVVAGTSDILVAYIAIQQLLMKVVVYFEKEIIEAAIEDDIQVAIFDVLYLVDNGMFFPCIFVLVHFAEQFAHPPVFREWTDVNTSTCAASGTKCLDMADG